MRNWNVPAVVSLPNNRQFWSYLWGIETRHRSHQNRSGRPRFWSYLWGIETRAWIEDEYRKVQFWSYLWGIETSLNSLNRAIRNFVLIVPMRNWNRCARSNSSPRHRFWSYLWGIETRPQAPAASRRTAVLIVPMRNWNKLDTKNTRRLVGMCWSYLWGIETTLRPSSRSRSRRVDRTYEELKQWPVVASHARGARFLNVLMRTETISPKLSVKPIFVYLASQLSHLEN